MPRILIILTIILMGCSTPSELPTINPIADKNKDVLILSNLIRDYLGQNDGRTFGLEQLYKVDSLKRIANNFEFLEMQPTRTGISVYFKFSKARDQSKIELTAKEKEMLVWKKWTEKRFDENYDGELRFEYPERSYHIKKLILKRE